MRALIAATCLSIMAAIGYYFWSEYQAEQERERVRVAITAMELETKKALEALEIEAQKQEKLIAQEQKKRAEEDALRSITKSCEINTRKIEEFSRRNAGRFLQTDAELKEQEKLRATAERCMEHYKMIMQRESQKFLLKIQEGGKSKN